ncbi:response regulator transcription factor (plasmid) [Clostridium estertheticum]|uniref:response regulator transcription factor n=1 Tax=Clostridium estertheticum TaxID=238834 RepID=UPI001C7D3A46|nr:response regulator transcription factor [Clostridium estertheticum]MBX4262256.1 response regulator transcription factor [Clostridium estertheticum]MCB2360844.1 response regulator transcription factor [Clostridium estertheticum]WLC72872.1 response regulator transcription factor [Clostridium estertheticum]
MGKYTILIIDDEQEIVELIEIYLINEGYQVFKAFNGAEGLEVLANQKIDLIVLDIMMPGVDGMETCRRIRQQMYLPIIMLSAKSEDMDRILGLGLGADDYLSKPFNPMELIARIKSQLRRYFSFNLHNQLNCDDNVIHIKDLVINKNNHSVSVYNKDANLTPTEYEILLLLASNSGIVFSAEKIFEKVWNEKYYESKNTVMVHIWRLREKVEKIPKEPKIIETVWGVGYKIEK